MRKEINTLRDVLENSVENFPSHNSFSYVNGTPYTYKEFGENVGKIANTLTSMGVGKGDKVAILSQNMPNFGVAYFAIITIGAVVVPILVDFSPGEVQNIVEHAECKAVFVSERLLEKNKNLGDFTPIMIATDNFYIHKGEEQKAGMKAACDIQPSDLASIIYTSGTTGRSKGVMLSHDNLVSQLKMLAELQPVNQNDIFLSVLPLPHAYECSLGLLYSVMSGASTYYLEKLPTPAVLLPALKKIRPTVMLSVPLIIEKIFKNSIYPKLTGKKMLKTMYAIPVFRKMMHRKAAKTLYEIFGGRLKFFGIGGSKLDRTVERFLIEGKVFPYGIGYGLTETAPLIAGANPLMVHLQSTGPVLNGVEMKINEPDSRTHAGEIWVRGRNIMLGYYKDETLSKEVLTDDGWFKTGDVGVFDKQGRLYIKGRLKNVIIGSNGENIYPEDIESVINSNIFVAESVVFEKKGKLVAMVNFNLEEVEKHYKQFKAELDERIDYLIQELITYVNAKVSQNSKLATIIAYSSEFDKTPTQKIKRYKYL